MITIGSVSTAAPQAEPGGEVLRPAELALAVDVLHPLRGGLLGAVPLSPLISRTPSIAATDVRR